MRAVRRAQARPKVAAIVSGVVKLTAAPCIQPDTGNAAYQEEGSNAPVVRKQTRDVNFTGGKQQTICLWA
jgi:hypothetical protein